MKWRALYAILWLLMLIGYSIPWARLDGGVYSGWNFTIPLSFTYLIGLLIGLIVLVVKYKPVPMTIAAGILMIIGIIGTYLGLGVAALLAGLTGATVEPEAGLGAAFLFSIIYTVAGAYAGKRMATTPSKSSTTSPTNMKASSSKAKWIAAIIVFFLLGLIFGSAASPGRMTTGTTTPTLPITTTITVTTTLTLPREGVTAPPPASTQYGKDIVIRIGEPAIIDDWEILIKSVKEVKYVRYYGSFYEPKQNMKIILADVKITNRAEDIREPAIGILMLVTDKGKIYEEIGTFSLEYLEPEKVTPQVKAEAVEYNVILWKELAPNAYVEGHVMFQIPSSESPYKIYIRISERWPKLAVVPIEIQGS